jgi:deoxyadenosine/deoxycytidine kinase
MTKNINESILTELFSDAEEIDEKSTLTPVSFIGQNLSTKNQTKLFNYEVVTNSNKIQNEKMLFRPRSEMSSSTTKIPFIISVEGLPGIDKENFFKSCILPVLEEFSLKSVFIQEPICNKFQNLATLSAEQEVSTKDRNTLGDLKKWAFIYQMCILKDKFLLYQRAYNLITQGTKVDVILLEKSIIGDDIYAQTHLEMEHITKIELEELNGWQELCNSHYSIKPHLIFYLKSNMELLKKKLNEESLPSGLVPNIKFFETLELMHSINFKMISKNTKVNIAVVDGMEFFIQDEKIKNKIIEGTKNVIQKIILNLASQK